MNPTARGCKMGHVRRLKHETAVDSGIALSLNIMTHGDKLERIEVFKYLSEYYHMMATMSKWYAAIVEGTQVLGRNRTS